jgi:hypothetical protein
VKIEEVRVIHMERKCDEELLSRGSKKRAVPLMRYFSNQDLSHSLALGRAN